MRKQISVSRISVAATNWKVGDILEAVPHAKGELSGKQFRISGYADGKIVLDILEDDERVKPDRIFSRLNAA